MRHGVFMEKKKKRASLRARDSGEVRRRRGGGERQKKKEKKGGREKDHVRRVAGNREVPFFPHEDHFPTRKKEKKRENVAGPLSAPLKGGESPRTGETGVFRNVEKAARPTPQKRHLPFLFAVLMREEEGKKKRRRRIALVGHPAFNFAAVKKGHPNIDTPRQRYAKRSGGKRGEIRL